MSNTNRLIKNSLFLYLRMFILMGIGFFTTRVILEALGVEDLGIYNVVGSLILMFDFISSGLTNSTQRYLNMGLGKNDAELTNKYFSQSLILHVGFIVLLTLIIETVGLWFTYNKLVIPPDRLEAAVIVFHLSTASLALRLFKICYESDIIAHEKMSIYAYLSVFEGVAKLLICYIIMANKTMDKLVLYGVLLFVINLIVTAINVVYCLVKYKETHFKWYSDKNVFMSLLSFVGINSFGVIAWAISKQGLNILLNLFFGPVVNGAKGVASNLERVIVQFGSNLQIATRPQITKYYAQNKIEEMVTLGEKSSLYIFYVMFIISLPFLFQTEDVLSIWLKEVPDFTAGFVRILMIESLLYTIGSTFFSVTLSTGKIKRTQVYGRLISLASLPVSYVLLHFWPNEYLPSVILAFSSLLYSLFIVWDADKILNFGIMRFLKNVYGPILLVCPIIVVVCMLFNMVVNIDATLLRFCVNSLFYCISALLIIYYAGMNKLDKQYLKFQISKKLRIS